VNSLTPDLFVEPLESRSLFAVTLTADPTRAGGVLTFSGTPGADHITVTRADEFTLPAVADGRTFVLHAVGDGGAFTQVVLPLSPVELSVEPAGPYAVISYEGDALRYFCPLSDGNRIVLDVGRGNDEVLISQSLAVKTTVIGAAGDDYLTGGAQFAALHGGAGNDYLRAVGSSAFLEGGSGDDWIVGTDRTGTGIVNEALGGDGDDIMVMRGLSNARADGNEGNDRVNGGGGNDELFGSDGNDVVNGGGGDDTLYGGIGADTLQGIGGNDLLIPGVGHDLVDGGWEEDIYVLKDGYVDRGTAEDGVDIIGSEDDTPSVDDLIELVDPTF
jgi:hypothetical protein